MHTISNLKMITATIIADSISPQGVRLTTFELTYPRFIHSELMTHRVFSRNAQSSRAVPVSKAIDLAKEHYTPFIWGKNKAGMSSNETLDQDAINACAYYWNHAVNVCKETASKLASAGLHKQLANRCLEWFSPIKVVVTATEWDNFFWLRIDPEAAQPEIVELASQMHFEMQNSHPQELKPGQWHLPYVGTWFQVEEHQQFYVKLESGEVIEISLETAKKVSAGCCAAVSYRNNPSIEKCLEIWEKLFSGPKPHLSPVEHLATPLEYLSNRDDVEFPYGATHMDRDGNYWSANFKGWLQCRQCL